MSRHFFYTALMSVLLALFCTLSGESSAKNKDAAESSAGKGRVILPKGFDPGRAEQKRYAIGQVNIDLYAKSFGQGNLVYCELYLNKAGKKKTALAAKKLIWGKYDIPFVQKSWGFRAFFPIGPEEPEGKKNIRLFYSLDGSAAEEDISFTVAKTAFPFRKGSLDLGRFSNTNEEKKPEIIAFIKECRKKKDKAFSSREADIAGGSTAHPRDMHYITSPFWSKRIYKRYTVSKGKRVRIADRTNIHRGVDLRGAAGTPVFAMAGGKIVLADFLYYEGNMVVIDHGNGWFSYYMHMSSLSAKTGDIVSAGTKIGRVGSSGISTAAHLHVSMIINGVHVDPLSLLCLPLRD